LAYTTAAPAASGPASFDFIPYLIAIVVVCTLIVIGVGIFIWYNSTYGPAKKNAHQVNANGEEQAPATELTEVSAHNLEEAAEAEPVNEEQA